VIEQICQNCEYFVGDTSDEAEYAFGHCMNPETSYVGKNGKVKGVFTWADSTCIDFKPRKVLE